MDEASQTQKNESAQDSSSDSSRKGKKVRRAVFPLLDKRFQMKVTLFFLFLILFSHLLLMAIHHRNLKSSTEGAMGMSMVTLELHLKKQNRVFIRDLLLGTVGITILVSFVVFYLTQKVAGPLFSMSRALDEMSKGNFDARVQLRNSDELHWFAEKINQTQKSLANRFDKG